jgi:hypothetical protein
MPDIRPGAEHCKIRPEDNKNASPVSAWRYLRMLNIHSKQGTLLNSVPTVPVVPLVSTPTYQNENSNQNLSKGMINSQVVEHLEQTEQSNLPTQEQIDQTYRLIRLLSKDNDGNAPIDKILNKAALKVLLKDGRVFDSNIPGCVRLS